MTIGRTQMSRELTKLPALVLGLSSPPPRRRFTGSRPTRLAWFTSSYPAGRISLISTVLVSRSSKLARCMVHALAE